MSKFQSIKIFLVKDMFLIRVKNTVPWTHVISDLNGEEIVGSYYEKNCKKPIKKNLELKEY